MRFRDDTRGVTVQVGAVLLFATIIIALSLYQATVVPSQNADVEYKHSQAVQGQLADVRNALLSTAATGNSQPTSVTLGTQYPSRVFLMNPPPATGTVRTGSYENDTVSVSNVRATNEETAQFIDGDWSAPTKYLVYEPDYHEYGGAADLRYESSILSNHYPDQNTTVPLTDQVVVRDDTITLVAVNGSLDTSQSGSVSVNPAALSAPYRRVQVEPNNPDEPVTVSLPTTISADTFRNQTDLGGRPNVTVVDGGPNRIELRLDGSDTYTLRTASVGVGSRTSNPEPHYLTVVENDGDSVTVEARDRFNNPEQGVAVSAAGASPFGESSRLTDVDGRATFEAGDGESGTVTLEILGGDVPRERVTASVDGTGTGTGTGGEAYDVEWTDATGSGVDCDAAVTACTVNADVGTTVALTATVTENGEPLTGAAVDYARNESTFDDPNDVTVTPTGGFTDGAGENRTTVDVPDENGSVTVYAASGGDADPLVLDVSHTPGEGDDSPDIDQFDVSDQTTEAWNENNRNPTYEVDWTVTDVNDDLSQVTLQLIDGSGNTQDTVTVSNPDSSSASGTTTLEQSDSTCTVDEDECEDYVIKIEATDDAGNTKSAQVTDDPDGDGQYDEDDADSQSVAYPAEFNDWDGSTTVNENNSIPPGSAARGTVSNFDRMQSDQRPNQYSGYATLETNYPSGASAHRVDIGTATYDVSTSGSTYRFVTEYRFQNVGPVDVQIVDESGAELQSFALAENQQVNTLNQTLNSDAREFVQDEGKLYVRYTDSSGGYKHLYVYFQRIEVES